ncbi:MAG: hypothetical protein F4Y99_05645 [Acidimicrobiaceae bacterium]|nr:hypothetical protein [Acidimicrobiaceae bacterium]MYF44691.1 hypothetical protein [Acidimicrobiaceae bacterium]MYJ34611.1 hypothetical protein [Acidimicrobiaceae bacterium]
MPHVLVRDVPENVHRKLTQRARANGTSLQRYLSSELARLAETPTLDEVIARIEQNSGGRVGFAQAVADLDEIRTERDQVLHERFEALAAREDGGPRH